MPLTGGGASQINGIQEVTIAAPAALTTWATMPSAVTELLGLSLHRAVADLTRVSQARIVVNVGTAALGAAVLAAQYSVDSGSNWFYLDGVSGPSVVVDTSGLRVGSWVTLVSAAQVGSCWLRVVGSGGNGVISPTLGRVAVEFR